jgi:hypothetical protein
VKCRVRRCKSGFNTRKGLRITEVKIELHYVALELKNASQREKRFMLKFDTVNGVVVKDVDEGGGCGCGDGMTTAYTLNNINKGLDLPKIVQRLSY